MKININYQGIPLVVDYKYEGKYFAATHEDLAEYPELDILKITVEDSEIDIQEMLHWKQIEEIESLIDG
jgi:hypothetical protein